MRQKRMFPSIRAVARGTDPETSHEAAASVANLTRKQNRVKQVLEEYGPMTDRQIFLALIGKGYIMSTSGARTRRRELCDLGGVEWTGMTTRLKSGRHSRIWYSVDADLETNQYPEGGRVTKLAVECPGCGHVFANEYSKFEAHAEPDWRRNFGNLFATAIIVFLIGMLAIIILGAAGNQ